VASGAGHLSNAQAAEAIRALRHGLREVVLMHVSEANNEPHLALRAADEALGRYRARVRVRVAGSGAATIVEVADSPIQLPLPI
jgi:phosphoribosyl 1,2-cyclic phosphodiesterase